MVVVSGPKMIDEVRKRPDEELSFVEGVESVRSTLPARALQSSEILPRLWRQDSQWGEVPSTIHTMSIL